MKSIATFCHDERPVARFPKKMSPAACAEELQPALAAKSFNVSERLWNWYF
jgi:hypothetical protein